MTTTDHLKPVMNTPEKQMLVKDLVRDLNGVFGDCYYDVDDRPIVFDLAEHEAERVLDLVARHLGVVLP